MEKKNEKKSFSKSLKNIALYILSATFMIWGLWNLWFSLFYGLSITIIWLMLLPQVIDIIKSKMQIKSFGWKYSGFLFLFFLIWSATMWSWEQNNDSNVQENYNQKIQAEQKTIIKKELTEEEKKQIEEKRKLEKQQIEEKRIAEAKDILQREINSIKNGIDYSIYDKNAVSIQLAVTIFSVWWKRVEEYQNDSNPEVKWLALELKNLGSKEQIRMFPILRKRYWKVADQIMWELNVDVTTIWASHWTIQFTWGIFAANTNKRESYSSIKSVLKQLRFDRANYLWYKYDDSYTYWEVWWRLDSEVTSNIE